MKIKTLIALLLLVPLVISSVAHAEEPTPPSDETPIVEDSVIIDSQAGVILDSSALDPNAVNRYMHMYGINWIPEKAKKFSKIKHNFNGTTTRVNTPGSYYVNSSIPLINYEDGRSQYLKEVQICGKSSKGSKVFPIRWKLYSTNNGNFYTGSIIWPADEDKHCVNKTYSTPVYQVDLMVSVLVIYKNTTQTFTFKDVWIRTLE